MGCKVRYKNELVDFSDIVKVYAQEMGINLDQVNGMVRSYVNMGTDPQTREQEIGQILADKLSREDTATPRELSDRSFVRLHEADTSSMANFYKGVSKDGKYSWLMDLADRAGIEIEVQDFGNMTTVGKYKRGKVTISPSTARYLEMRKKYSPEALERTLAHETLHGLIEHLPDEQRIKMREELHEFFQELKQETIPNQEIARLMKIIEQDGIDELVTYAFTNKTFASWLNSIQSSAQDSGQTDTLWRKLAKIIAGAFEFLTGKSKLGELADIMEGYGIADSLNLHTEVGHHISNSNATFKTYYERIVDDNVLSPAQVRRVQNEGKATHLVPTETEIKAGDEITVTLGESGVAERVIVESVDNVAISEMNKEEIKDLIHEMGDFLNISEFNNYYRLEGTFGSKFNKTIESFILDNAPAKIVRFRLKDFNSESLSSIQDKLAEYHKRQGQYDVFIQDILRNIESELQTLEGVTAENRSQIQTSRMARLRKMRRDLTGLKDIEEAIEGVYYDLKAAEELMDALSTDKNALTDREAIHFLHQYSRIALTYSPLFDQLGSDKDIEILLEKLGEEADVESLFKRLNEARVMQSNMLKLYYEKGVDMMTDYLYPLISDKTKTMSKEYVDARMAKWAEIEQEQTDPEKKKRIQKIIRRKTQIWNRTILTKEKLRESLLRLDKDAPIHRAWIDEAIESADPALALWAVDLTAEYERMRRELLTEQNELQSAFSEFIQATGRSKHSPQKLHEGLYEVIPDKQNGYQDRVSFVQPFNWRGYVDAYEKVLKKAKDKTPKERAKLFAQFHEENSEPIDQNEIDKQVDEIKQQWKNNLMLDRDVQEWAMRHMSPKQAKEYGLPFDGKITRYSKKYFKNDFIQPNEQYRSKKWTEIYKKEGDEWVPRNAIGEYHKYLTDYYSELQKKIPKNMRPGWFVPSVKERGYDKLIHETEQSNLAKGTWSTIMEGIKEKTQIDPDEVKYGAASLYGAESQVVPIWFTRYQDPSETSRNISGSIAEFAKHIKIYQAQTNVLDTSLVLDDILKKREVKETVGGIRPVIDKMAARFGRYKEGNKPQFSNRAYKQYHTAVRMFVFGEARKTWEVPWVNGKTLYADKMVDLVMGWTAFSSLGFSAIKAATNWATAKSQNLYDLQMGPTSVYGIAPQNMAKGQKTFVKYSKDILFTDFNKVGNKTWINQVIDRFAFIQDDHWDQYGKRFSKPTWRNIMESGPAFAGMRIGEIESALSYAFAVMHEKRVKKGDKTISLWEALKEDENGKLVIDEEVEFDEQALMNEIHSRLRRNQGNYAKMTVAPAASQYVGNRAVLFFRGYLWNGVKRRFDKPRLALEQEGPHEGIYVSALEAVQRNYIQHGMKLKKWDTLDAYEQENVRKAIAETTMATGMMVIVASLYSILKEGDYDDDEPLTAGWAYWHLMYLLNRVSHEMATFISVMEYARVIQEPFIAMGHITKMWKLAGEALPVVGWNKYQQDTGPWEKGQYKITAQALKLAGFTGETLHPKQAYENYESAVNR